MTPKNILTKEFLTEHYINQRKSDKSIADEFGIKSCNSVYQARIRHGVARNSLKDSSQILTKDFLIEYYVHQNMTLKQVAQLAGFQRKSIVSKALKKHNIPQREHTRSQAVINRKPRKHHTIPGRYFCSLKHSANSRGLEFNLTLDDLWNIFTIQNGKCALSGLDIRFHQPGEKFTAQTASVDRINNDIGYIKSNIRWVHKDINYMKMDLTDERFFYLCQQILSQHNRDNLQ